MRFGSGGQDSKNFVQELTSAYLRYAQSKGFRCEFLDTSDGHVLVKITGNGVWRAFRHETGQHACQRVPVTERNGRRQTSLVAVGVLPIKDDVYAPLDMKEVEIKHEMCRLTSGGQAAQKNATAIRATHKPTGIQVFIQNERSQAQNLTIALRVLTARVNDARQAKVDAAYADFRRKHLGDGNRGAKIRTYNWLRNQVTDHNLGTKTSNLEGVMRGKLELIIHAKG